MLIKVNNGESYMCQIKKTAVIAACGSYLPQERVTSHELLIEIKSDEQYGIAHNWISDAMGIIERRMAPMTATPSELAIKAAKQALDSVKDFDTKSIDLVIFCGIERDQPEPSTAHVVQNALGLTASRVFDVSNACIGFVDALEIANMFIASSQVIAALVVTGEVPTRVTRHCVDLLRTGVPLKKARNIIGALTVGDAGGAVILTASDNGNGFQAFNTFADSSHVDKCIYKQNPDGTMEGRMLMAPIVRRLLQMHEQQSEITKKKLGWDSFDWLITHQTGKRNFHEFSRISSVPLSNMTKTYDYCGNTTSATFALNWEKLINSGKVSVGARIGGMFTGSGLSTCQFGFRY